MKKKTLGLALKEARTALGFTQRGFAREVGVKPSHIAYLESDQRRPSLPLLSRICAALGLDRRAMLFLSYPEVKEMVGDSQASDREKPRNDAWRRFRTNRTLLKRHNVTRGELAVLERVSRLEPVSDSRHFIFVLNAIRQAAVPED
ncbi:MAG TPA: helix-turn-helix transcriptional regulator [Candidatus Binataceae bacterium]|nr:helix-turn-helix transcriptional regulator [Candidatus Binataceae bacterium]